MGVRLGVKIAFSLLVGAVFGYVSWLIIYGAAETAGFVPSSSQDIAFSMVAGGLVAFIAAQLGITVARQDDGNGLVRRLSGSMGSDTSVWPGVVLIVLTLAYVAAGFGFMWLWLSPENIAVAAGADKLTEAPAYIATPAKTFLGLLLGGLAGLGAAAQQPDARSQTQLVEPLPVEEATITAEIEPVPTS